VPPDYTYDYAIVRIVPRVERGERINVGVILSCVDETFLDCRLALDPERLRLLDPALDVDSIRASLATIPLARGWCHRRVAAAWPLPMAGVSAQHGDSDVAGAHRADDGSSRCPRPPAGDHGAARGQALGFRLWSSLKPQASSLRRCFGHGRPLRTASSAGRFACHQAAALVFDQSRAPSHSSRRCSNANASGGRRAGSFSRHASTGASTERGIGVEDRADGGAGTVLT
jgi:hypothetical protein